MPFAFATVRLFSFLPLFVAAYAAVPIWFKVRSHPAPPDAAWGNDIYTGLVLGAAGTIFGCIQNGIAFMPSAFVKNVPFLLTLLLLDAVVVGLLLASVVREAEHLPGTLNGCNQFGDSPSSDSQASLFTFIAAFYNSTPRGACRRLFLPWICMVVIAAVYGALMVCEIIYVFAKGDWDTPTNRSIGSFIIRYPSLPIRFTTSYIRKLRLRRIAIDLNAIPLKQTASPLFCSCPDLNTPSSPLYSPQCWSCTRIICSNCRHTRSLTPPPSTAHLELCIPHCTYCHIRSLLRRRSRIRDTGYLYSRPKVVSCAHNITTSPPHSVERIVCGPCSMLPDSVLVNQRGQREEDEIRALEISRMMKCAGCERRIGGREGVRWWWCGLGNGDGCGRECRDEIHAAWGD